SANLPAYAPTYYPGTASFAEAQRLAIAAGQTVTGINMSVLPVRGMRVTGTIVVAGGRPANSGSVALSELMGVGPSMVMAPIKPGGAFSLSNVTPGEYVLRWMGPDLNERAQMPVTVGGGDLDG